MQFFCEYSTVIYTSIAILNWEFSANWKVSRRHRTSGGGYPRITECCAPIHALQPCCASLWIPYAVSTLQNSLTKPLENSLTKPNWHTRCTFFCCAYERMVIHGPNIPIRLSGGDTWLFRIRSVVSVFCFHIPFLQAIYSRSVCMDLCWHTALRQCW